MLLSSRLDLKRAKSAARASLASVPLANRAVKQRRSWAARGADETWGVNASAFGRVRADPARGRARWVGLASDSPLGGEAPTTSRPPGGAAGAFALEKGNELPELGFAERVRLFAVRQERGAD